MVVGIPKLIGTKAIMTTGNTQFVRDKLMSFDGFEIHPSYGKYRS